MKIPINANRSQRRRCKKLKNPDDQIPKRLIVGFKCSFGLKPIAVNLKTKPFRRKDCELWMNHLNLGCFSLFCADKISGR